jgi:WD40 repeat protein
VSASQYRTVKVWDLESGRELYTLQGYNDRVRSAAISGDGRVAVTTSSTLLAGLFSLDQSLKVWDVKSGRELRSIATTR